MIVQMYVAVFAVAALASGYAAVRPRRALIPSLVAAILWLVWANASYTVEAVSGGEVTTMSHPTLAIVGYVAGAVMLGFAVISAVSELTPDGEGVATRMEEVMRRV